MLALTRLLLILIVCFYNYRTCAQHVEFRNYLNEEGSNSSTIYHVFHDSKGFTWFGTEYGVTRFDGKNYLKLTISDGLSDNEVLKIQEDSKGRIWFLTFNGRFSYYYNGKIFNENNNPVLKKIGTFTTLSNLYEDRKGNLWFSGIHNQFLRVSPLNEITRYDFRKTGLLGKESFFYEDGRGNVMLVCREGFFTISGQTVIPKPFPYKLINFKTHYMVDKSSLLFLSEKGIITMKDTVQHLLIPSKNLPHNPKELSYIYKDLQENIWISTLGNGVFLLKNQNYSTKYHYLPGTIVSSIKQDTEGNMWFSTTDEGVYMLPSNQSNFSSYTKNEGLTSNKIYSIAKDKSNTLWLGLNNGIVNSLKSGKITKYDLNFSKTFFNRVNDIFVDDSSNIWCTTDVGGVKLLRKRKKFKKINIRYLDESGVATFPFAGKSIAKAANKKQPTFIHSGNVAALVPNPFSKKAPGYTIQDLAGFPKTRTYSHFYDHNGSLWYANINGLYQHIGKTNKIFFGQNNFLLSRRITDIAESQDSAMYLATYGYGIILFKNGKILNHITKKQGLPSDICKKILVQGAILWVSTNEGLSKITFNKSKVTSIENYQVANGLLSNDIQDVYADDQGVYIATSKGLSILTRSNLQIKSSPPPVYFTKITAVKKNITNQSGVKHSYEYNRFVFNFIGITYQDPAKVKYVYRLLGSNENWVATANNTVEFSALAPGDYVFEVKARKQNSNWSQPIRYSFVVNSPFWQAWWFISVMALLGIGIFVLLSWYFLQQKLKTKIRSIETEHKIQLERERIARDLHDNVGSHLTYIINKLDDSFDLTHAPEQYHQMAQLREFTKQTITQLRETIWAIRKENVSVGELNEKLRKLLRQIFPTSGAVSFQFKTQTNESILLTPVQTLNIFRIAQEAINNVLKHSQADFLTVHVSTISNKYLQLLLQDNGIGFEPTQVNETENYGLANMHERAKELKATLEIKSDKGKGTQVILLVDLAEATTTLPPLLSNPNEPVLMNNPTLVNYTKD